jgi:hypothetical protein
VHTPVWHEYVWLQWFVPVGHTVPFGAAGFEHSPLPGSHVPGTWHESLALHVTGFDPVHAPARHEYAWLHLFVPVHPVPSVTAGFEQAPVAGSHVPATWH